MNEEMLIRLVRHYEFLYDSTLPKHNDPKKVAAWNEISQVMNQPARKCKYNWQYLRNAYRKALNNRKRISYQPSAEIKKWKYEDEISFLNKYLWEKKPKATQNEERPVMLSIIYVQRGEKDSAENIEQDIEAMDPLNIAHSPSDLPGNVQKNTQKLVASQSSPCSNDTTNYPVEPQKEHTRKEPESNHPEEPQKEHTRKEPESNHPEEPQKEHTRKEPESNHPEEPQKEHTRKEPESNHPEKPQKEHTRKEPESNHDQMDLFFLMLSNTVKSFSPYLQAIAKNKIFNLVSEMEIQQLAPGINNTASETSTIPQTTNWPTRRERSSSNVRVKVENEQ